jgi:hypothetical protein
MCIQLVNITITPHMVTRKARVCVCVCVRVCVCVHGPEKLNSYKQKTEGCLLGVKDGGDQEILVKNFQF